MEAVCTANDVKVYNLSAGKSLPEVSEDQPLTLMLNRSAFQWISDRKRRALLKSDLGWSIPRVLVCECVYVCVLKL